MLSILVGHRRSGTTVRQRHVMANNSRKKRKLFDCAEAVKPLKCFKCPSFETHNLVDFWRHFRGLHSARPKPARKVVRNNCQDKIFKCEDCPFSTRHFGSLKRHTLFKHGSLDKIVPFECALCSYKFNAKVDLNRHMSILHGIKKISLKCDSCPFQTTHKYALKLHVSSKHDLSKIQWFECEQCLYRCKAKSSLKIHLQYKHSKKIVLKCDLCTYETYFKCSLKHHVSTKHK